MVMLWLIKRRSFSLKMYQRAIRSPFLCLVILTLTIIIVILLAFRLQTLEIRTKECPPVVSQFDSTIRSYSNTTDLKPIIFIGGMPRSGTTLMRAILDSHPLVRCGEETRVIPRLLSMKTSWKKSTAEWNRLLAGGITENILDSAVRAFIYEILVRHGHDSDVLCDKDPFVLKYATYVSSMFPKSKFLLLIRDGRAVLHSIMTRHVTITGFSQTDYRQNLKLWNQGIEKMVDQCMQLGEQKCFMVYYEQLVLQPKITIENILKFLNLNWVDEVLHHEELVGKKISLSKTEHSSDQVVKPINLEALTKWVGHVPNDVKKELDTLAPMLKKLGYDTKAEKPNYGVPDQVVLDNMNELKKNAALWDAKAKAYARQVPNQTRIMTNSTMNSKTN